MFDVISVGSATVDCFVYTDKSQLITVRTEKDEKAQKPRAHRKRE